MDHGECQKTEQREVLDQDRGNAVAILPWAKVLDLD